MQRKVAPFARRSVAIHGRGVFYGQGTLPRCNPRPFSAQMFSHLKKIIIFCFKKIIKRQIEKKEEKTKCGPKICHRRRPDDDGGGERERERVRLRDRRGPAAADPEEPGGRHRSVMGLEQRGGG